METELWPNTIAACHKRNIPVLLANGRLSEKSAKAYRRINGLVRPMMCQISQVAAQHKDDADRFSDLGVTDSALSVTGNVKFDLTISESLEQKAVALSADWRGRSRRPVILAASTHRGEDEIVLEGFKKIKERLGSALLVLVPRHPERFNQVADLCHKAGFSLNRRSEQLKEVQAAEKNLQENSLILIDDIFNTTSFQGKDSDGVKHKYQMFREADICCKCIVNTIEPPTIL